MMQQCLHSAVANAIATTFCLAVLLLPAPHFHTKLHAGNKQRAIRPKQLLCRILLGLLFDARLPEEKAQSS